MSNHPEIQKWPHDPIDFDKDVPDENQGHGWIQWKGSDACVDLHCRCGTHGHFDGWFLYFYKCPACGETFAVGQTVRLYPIAKDKVAEIAKDSAKTSMLEVNNEPAA